MDAFLFDMGVSAVLFIALASLFISGYELGKRFANKRKQRKQDETTS